MELSQLLSASERRGVNSPSPQRPKFCTCVPAPLRLPQLCGENSRVATLKLSQLDGHARPRNRIQNRNCQPSSRSS